MRRHQLLLSVLAVMWWTVSVVVAETDCTGYTGFKCDSCSSLALCSEDTVATTFSCGSDEMCEEGDSPPGSCKLISESSRTKCKCSTFPSYIVDSYDSTKYILCFSSTMQFPLTCPDGQEFDEVSSGCVSGPTTTSSTSTTTQAVTCTEAGLFPVLPSCSGYYGCYDVGGSLISTGVVSCEGAKLFDPDTSTCVDSITGPATPACAEDDFVTADTVECNAFYVCSGGNVVGEKICCGEGEVFNPDTIRCEADTGSVTCPSVNPCYTGEVTLSCATDTTSSSSTSSTTSSTVSTSLSSSSESSSSSSSSSSSTDSSSSSSTSSTDSSSSDSTSSTDSSSSSTSTDSSSSITSTDSSSSSTSTDGRSTSTSTDSSSTSSSSTESSSSSSDSTSSTDSSSSISTSSTERSTSSSTFTSSKSTSTSGIPNCSEESGSFAYPGDCTKYYFCYEGELAEQSCSGSLIFSPGVGCTLPSNYDCPY